MMPGGIDHALFPWGRAGGKPALGIITQPMIM
jgi:hypothetical protein